MGNLTARSALNPNDLLYPKRLTWYDEVIPVPRIGLTEPAKSLRVRNVELPSRIGVDYHGC
jgi:hypothetical protein